MDTPEFFYHLQIIKNLLKDKSVRIILVHPSYTKTQQKIIDSICRNSTKIIGQVERKPPIVEVAKEIERLIAAHTEPFIPSDQLQYVVVGQQKLK